MEFFPTLPSEKQTIEFIIKMQNQFTAKGFCYFAVDKLDDQEMIGFIGLSEQNFKADFTPCIDVGWRLKAIEWNKGYATEGAKRCLQYAFKELNLNKVNALAPKVNIKSQRVINKIGMTKVMNFKHPLLSEHNNLEECILYEILNNKDT